MILNYKRVRTFFDENFSSYQNKEGKKYYFNQEGKIVGIGDNKIITTYYKGDQINPIYAVSVAKNMLVGKGENQSLNDIMHVGPINKLYKDTTVEKNFAIKTNISKDAGIYNRLATIGAVTKGQNGKRILVNQDFVIEVPSREFVKRDFFDMGKQYLINLQTNGKTNEIDYSEVYDYYKKEYASNNYYPGKSIVDKNIENKKAATYDGIVDAVIIKTAEFMKEDTIEEPEITKEPAVVKIYK